MSAAAPSRDDDDALYHRETAVAFTLRIEQSMACDFRGVANT